MIDVIRQPIGRLLTSPGAAPKRRRKQPRRNLGVPQELGVHRGVLCVGPLPPESGRLNDVERHGRNGNWTRRAGSKAPARLPKRDTARVMSEENVEHRGRVRAVLEAWTMSSYQGRDGVIQAFREWVEPFSEYYSEALDFIEVGDRVVVPNRQRGIGSGSGIPVEIEVTHVYEVRDGQIARVDEYDTLEEALEAAGLSE